MLPHHSPATHPSLDYSAQARQKGSVGLIAIPVSPVHYKAHRNRWLHRLPQWGVLPVVDSRKKLKGLLYHQHISRDALLSPPHLSRAQAFMSSPWPALQADASVVEADELMQRYNVPLIPIVDKQGRYSGQCASCVQQYWFSQGVLRPAKVGGFSTPFGVSLTTGKLSSGVGPLAVAATGAMLGVVCFVLHWLVMGLSGVAGMVFPGWPMLYLHGGNHAWMLDILTGGAHLMLFLLFFRFANVSGFHAAEHQVVHTIESNLPLIPAVVSMQPREHPRCGTSLTVWLLGIQGLIFHLNLFWGVLHPIGLMVYTALWLTLLRLFALPAGLWLQRHFTTRPASPAQLNQAIQAGEQLMHRFAQAPHTLPSVLERLLASRMLLVLAGFALVSWGLFLLFHV